MNGQECEHFEEPNVISGSIANLPVRRMIAFHAFGVSVSVLLGVAVGCTSGGGGAAGGIDEFPSSHLGAGGMPDASASSASSAPSSAPAPVSCGTGEQWRAADCAGMACACEKACTTAADCVSGCCAQSKFCAPACVCGAEKDGAAVISASQASGRCLCWSGSSFCPTLTCSRGCVSGPASACGPFDKKCDAPPTTAPTYDTGSQFCKNCPPFPLPAAHLCTNNAPGMQCNDPARHCCPTGLSYFENGKCYPSSEAACLDNAMQCPSYACY